MTTTPARRLTRKGEQTRARIVEAAADLMFVRGVAGTTLDHVRAEAGVSSSQIYHYFSDKDALVRAVVAFQNDAIVGQHERSFATLDSVPALRAWRDQIVAHQERMQCQGGCPIAALGSELGELDLDAREGVAIGFHRWQAAIRHGFEAMQSRGTLPAEVDVETLATATLAALQGGLLLCQMHRSTAPLAAALDTMLDHVESLAQ
ncbi:TetR/AcrR family transcriptional regulator [Nocardioides mangrovi]|uniref:TetR/AcrR family transcriptional regulator n=1 Tax=Nocardioides mangrovi TaxID=2874580 RepID=A0ABS7UCX1_9ACTN|nr:TetR/AcrR family transcriptional regulator [Nocardioides mangrovi]MBZ5738848.1 TetR/AcrR family transcriptional regulator [Nocardioides mangrovi]